MMVECFNIVNELIQVQVWSLQDYAENDDDDDGGGW